MLSALNLPLKEALSVYPLQSCVPGKTFHFRSRGGYIIVTVTKGQRVYKVRGDIIGVRSRSTNLKSVSVEGLATVEISYTEW